MLPGNLADVQRRFADLTARAAELNRQMVALADEAEALQSEFVGSLAAELDDDTVCDLITLAGADAFYAEFAGVQPVGE